MPRRVSTRVGGHGSAPDTNFVSEDSSMALVERDALPKTQLEGRSHLAKRIAKVKNHPDMAIFNERVAERNAFVRIVDTLFDKMHLAPAIWNSMENGVVRPNAKVDAEAHAKVFFEAKLQRVGQLPVAWRASFIVRAARDPPNITPQLMDKLDGKNPDSLLNLFCLGCCVAPSTPMPPQCAHKETCMKVFLQRYDNKGKRYTNLAKHISADGAISWADAGAFTLTFGKTGLLESIRHIEGSVVLAPDYLQITRAFQLVDPWLDGGAKLTRGVASYNLVELFDSDTPARQGLLDKKGTVLLQIAKTVAQELHDREKQIHDDQAAADASCLHSHDAQVSEKRKQSLGKARTLLMVEQKRRRVVNLGAEVLLVIADAPPAGAVSSSPSSGTTGTDVEAPEGARAEAAEIGNSAACASGVGGLCYSHPAGHPISISTPACPSSPLSVSSPVWLYPPLSVCTPV